jgi:hypothetical protein
MPSDKFWKMLDDEHPHYVEDLVKLMNWSQNCDYPTPMTVFSDLTGYSEETYGCQLIEGKMPLLGYKEIGLLAAALEEYSNRPQDVFAFMRELDAEESK